MQIYPRVRLALSHSLFVMRHIPPCCSENEATCRAEQLSTQRIRCERTLSEL